MVFPCRGRLEGVGDLEGFDAGSHRFTEEAFDHLLAALILALKGSCCIYQGDELGLTEAEIPYEKMQDPFGLAGYPSILGRDGCRTPMPWLILSFISYQEPHYKSSN